MLDIYNKDPRNDERTLLVQKKTLVYLDIRQKSKRPVKEGVPGQVDIGR